MSTNTSLARTGVGPRRPAVLAAVILLVASLATGCGGRNGEATGTGPSKVPGGGSASPSQERPTAPGSAGTPGSPPTALGKPTASRKVRVSAYFLHGEHVSPVPRKETAPTTAAGAIRALLAGPNSFEKKHDRTTSIPSGTELNSVVIRDRVATVDLSEGYDDGGGSLSMRARLAQVVFTATQFPSVEKVSFELDGKPVSEFGGEGILLEKPVGRVNFEDLAPAVLVESPLIGDTIHNPVRVWGSANTFEATFRLEIKDATGKTVAYPYVTATSGTGTRGTFDVSIPYKTARSGTGWLIASYDSPKDGRSVTVDTIPLTVHR